jgi:peptidoglycan hydrolase-like protein with peptidoglycan-binding domain
VRRIVSLLAGAITVVGGLVFTSAGTASADPSANAWYQLRMCESSNRYDINTGNGYYGAYQFDLPTWRSVGGSGYPNQASKAEQDYRALILYRMRGWSPWVCAALVGLQPDSDAASGVMPPRPGSSASGGGSASGSTGGSQSGSDTGSSTPAWPGRQYHEGDYSAKLKVWQQQAGKLGYGLVGTGYFGPHTEKAVRAIQRKAGLNVVGFIGPKTWAAAWDTSNAKNANNSTGSGSGSTVTYVPQTDKSCHVGAAKAPTWPGKQFRFGQTARELQCFQKELGHRGYYLLGTGYYGSVTKSVVLDLQRRNGIPDSGIVGPKTWKAAWEGKVR